MSGIKFKIGLFLLLFVFSCNSGQDLDIQATVDEVPLQTLEDNPLGKNLFVSTHGDDSYSYEENNIDHPWATVQHGWYNSRPGDQLFIRGGHYTTQVIDLSDNGVNGTAQKPIKVLGYPGEEVTIQGNGQGGSLIYMDKEYHSIGNLTIRGENIFGGVIGVGYDRSGIHFSARDCTLEVLSVAPNADCTAAIRLYSILANFTEIRNCRLIGMADTSGIIIFRSQGVVLENCEISGGTHGLFFKHSNALNGNTELQNLFRNNFIHSCLESSVFGVPNYALFENNVIVDKPFILGVDGGVGDGYVGADYNVITHNSFINTTLTFTYEGRSADEDPNRGCLYNRIENNLFTQTCRFHPYGTPDGTEDYDYHLSSDYNLYPQLDAVVKETNQNYSFSQWQIHKGSDQHSIQGNAEFVSAQSTLLPQNYHLSSNSPGRSAARDGTDMGANLGNVGLQ